MSSIEENKRIAAAFLRLLGENDVDGLMKLLSDNLEYWVGGNLPGLSGVHTKSELAAMMPMTATMFPDGLKVAPTEMTGEGGRVAVEARGGGRTADGRTYDNTYHFLFEIENGTIVKIREYMDTQHAGEIFAAA